jgi:hypothetical protein
MMICMYWRTCAYKDDCGNAVEHECDGKTKHGVAAHPEMVLCQPCVVVKCEELKESPNLCSGGCPGDCEGSH